MGEAANKNTDIVKRITIAQRGGDGQASFRTPNSRGAERTDLSLSVGGKGGGEQAKNFAPAYLRGLEIYERIQKKKGQFYKNSCAKKLHARCKLVGCPGKSQDGAKRGSKCGNTKPKI